MERNVSRHHTELLCLNARAYRIVLEGVQQGPLIGYFGTKFQVQSVIIWGTVLASFAVGSCYFAEDIYIVITLWGVVYAFGFGMATISIPEVLAQNFDEYLTNANGLAFSGECIGGSLLPPLLVVYLDTYGLSGAFFILFGLTSTSIPAALLLNPKYHQQRTTISEKSSELLPGHKISSEAFKVLSSTRRVSDEVFGPDESSMSAETKKLSVAKDSNTRINIRDALQNAGRFSAYQGIFNNSNKIYLKTYGIKSKSLESIPTFVSAKPKHMFKPKVPAHNTKIIQIGTERKPHISEKSSKNTFRIGQDILNDLYNEIEEKRISLVLLIQKNL
ncbi:uncharacterized protein TNCV_1742201 [Trichonephila clavipes]|nr:uncharacterized protein TNCV_1742201 [Trichonephila clavipes]